MDREKNFFMNEALILASIAAQEGEVPVGAVVVCNGKIIGRGRNRREKEKNALAHAEIEAINEACRTLGGWRLLGCEIFVNLEPCPMCAGAIINARIESVYFSLRDSKSGAFGSVINLNSYPLNHKAAVFCGLLEKESEKLIKDFFKNLRK